MNHLSDLYNDHTMQPACTNSSFITVIGHNFYYVSMVTCRIGHSVRHLHAYLILIMSIHDETLVLNVSMLNTWADG